MENQNSATKIMVKFGVILGVLTVLVSVMNYSFGNIYEPHWSVKVLEILLMVGVIVYGLREFKQLNNNFLSIGQSIKTGLGISLIASIIGIVYLFLFMNVIEPDFMMKMEEFQQKIMYEKFPDMSEEQLEQTLTMTKKLSTPSMTAMFSLIGSLFFGLIISLVVGLIMKNEEPQY